MNGTFVFWCKQSGLVTLVCSRSYLVFKSCLGFMDCDSRRILGRAGIFFKSCPRPCKVACRPLKSGTYKQAREFETRWVFLKTPNFSLHVKISCPAVTCGYGRGGSAKGRLGGVVWAGWLELGLCFVQSEFPGCVCWKRWTVYAFGKFYPRTPPPQAQTPDPPPRNPLF